VPLHFGGVAGRVKELYAVAERHHLRIVEDATHAFGTRVDGRPSAASAT
jgi:dTDP-4-amino-4,6-dideoxygalactose transaminase